MAFLLKRKSGILQFDGEYYSKSHEKGTGISETNRQWIELLNEKVEVATL